MKYRADIDGLRALAVVPVVLYHAKFSWLSGGYVGVDMFFVISGFLITTIIFSELQNDKFSIIKFYERRILRILPALFAMLSATLVVGMLIMLPQDFQNLTSSAVATLVFGSNVFFYTDGGYFSAPSESKALLHTWSLAVEEQFYIFWPVLLMITVRFFNSRTALAICVVLAASFCLSEYQVRSAPDAAFYLLPSRAWELAIGASLALGFVPPIRNRIYADAIAILGLCMVLTSLFGYQTDTPFPGASALLPCVGTTLIIWAGTEGSTLVGRILGSRPIVFIGLISYSLYLWHWPVFVLATYARGEVLTAGAYTILVGVAVVLAILSWRYVETPFRSGKNVLPLRRIMVGLGSLACVIMVLGVVSWTSGGIPQRLSPDVLAIASGQDDYGIRDETCLNRGLARISTGDLCRFGGDETPSGIRFLLWGDSHAESLAPAFRTLARKYEAKGWYASRNACPPIIGMFSSSVDKKAKCRRFNQAMHAFAKENKITDIVLVARWNLYAEGWPKWGVESRSKTQFYINDEKSTNLSLEENKKVLSRGLHRTVASLKKTGARVWVVEQVPYVGYRVPEVQAIALHSPFASARPGVEKSKHQLRSTFMRETLASLQETLPVQVLDASNKLCEGKTCRVMYEMRPLYRDDDHLSGFGADWIASTFQPVFGR